MEYKCSYTSPLGELLLVANDEFLTGILIKGSKFFPQSRDMELSESEPEIIQRTKMWLDIYFDGKEPDFTIPIKMEGTAFQKEVWEILLTIPYGRVTSYGEIASLIAKRRGINRMSARAVGAAAGKNKILILIPCHRVIGENSKLTGFAGGIDKKELLLEIEKADFNIIRISRSNEII